MNMRTTLILAPLLLLPLAFAAAVCGGETTRIETPGGDNRNGITVAGEGKVTARPDIAMLSLGVSALAPSVGEAREQAAAALNAMIDSMKANGIDEDDLQTQQLSISPEYDYRGETQTLRGFRVSNVITAKVRDIDTTGKVVDDAVAAGGDTTQIQSISFTIDDPTQLQEQARSLAVADAKKKAETLASASGVGIGAPIAISEGSLYVPLNYADGESFAADRQAAAPTPIEPGELDVVINVSVTWEIK